MARKAGALVAHKSGTRLATVTSARLPIDQRSDGVIEWSLVEVTLWKQQCRTDKTVYIA